MSDFKPRLSLCGVANAAEDSEVSGLEVVAWVWVVVWLFILGVHVWERKNQ